MCQRERKIILLLEGINTVKWSPNGELLATASNDRSVKLFDFGTGKTITNETTADGRKFSLPYDNDIIHSNIF